MATRSVSVPSSDGVMRAAKINADGITHLRSVLALAYETTLNLASICITIGNSNATPIQKISDSNKAMY